MKNFRLRIAASITVSSFAASTGSFASAHDDTQKLSQVECYTIVAPFDPPEQPVESSEMCLDEDAPSINVPFDGLDMIPLASYQDCVNTCKAGIVAIEAMCRFIPDPRAKALCWAARFTTPACIGFCGWYFGK